MEQLENLIKLGKELGYEGLQLLVMNRIELRRNRIELGRKGDLRENMIKKCLKCSDKVTWRDLI